MIQWIRCAVAVFGLCLIVMAVSAAAQHKPRNTFGMALLFVTLIVPSTLFFLDLVLGGTIMQYIVEFAK